MLVSVIIPCYNAEAFIAETIASACSQTHHPLEIICVDNGSSDNTISILQQLKEKDNRISVMRESRKGANYARNTGLSAAKGEAVQFLDSDDVIHPGKIEQQVKALIENQADLVVSDRAIYDKELKTKLRELTFEKAATDPLVTAITEIIITGNPLYLKKALVDAGSWNESLKSAQDWELHIRLALEQKKMVYLPGSFLKSRQHDQSLSANWIKVNFDAVKVLERYKEAIKKSGVTTNPAVRKKIFFSYFLAAMHAKNSSAYIDALDTWAIKSDYTKFLSGPNKLLYRLLGFKLMVRTRSAFSGKKQDIPLGA